MMQNHARNSFLSFILCIDKFFIDKNTFLCKAITPNMTESHTSSIIILVWGVAQTHRSTEEPTRKAGTVL